MKNKIESFFHINENKAAIENNFSESRRDFLWKIWVVLWSLCFLNPTDAMAYLENTNIRNVHNKKYFNYKDFLLKIKTDADIKYFYEKLWKDDFIESKKESILNYLSEYLKEKWVEISSDEFFIYVDKSLQRVFILKNNEILWYSKVSTWNSEWIPKKKDEKYFETPDIVINRNEKIFFESWNNKVIKKCDWRTPSHKTSWYWEVWSKIIFLWRYHVDEKWNPHVVKYWYNSRWKKISYIEKNNWKKIKKIIASHNLDLAMHKTWKNREKLLWQPASHWCIRVSPETIDLIDSLKLLDWEKWKFVVIWDYKNSIKNKPDSDDSFYSLNP